MHEYYIIAMFLLVSCMNTGNLWNTRKPVVFCQVLCTVNPQNNNSEQKPTTKNFAGFHNHFPLLAMFKGYKKQSKNGNERLHMQTNNSEITEISLPTKVSPKS